MLHLVFFQSLLCLILLAASERVKMKCADTHFNEVDTKYPVACASLSASSVLVHLS